MVSHNLRFRFTLVSYNILSQTLLNDHGYLYNNCNPRDLEWPRRGHKIVKELLDNQADIICLQEVESEHLKSLYRPRLARYGYECLYKKKTGYKVDGCAIFYKSKLFHLLNYKGVEFNRTDVAYMLDRDNVGIIAILKPRMQTKSESSHLIIANTHLIFNPKRCDIKLAQLKFFLSELENMSLQSCSHAATSDSHNVRAATTTTTMTATATRSSSSSSSASAPSLSEITRPSTSPCHYPTILCGDLNSTPDSEVSRYLLRATSPRDEVNRDEKVEMRQTTNDDSGFDCDTQHDNATNLNEDNDEEREATNQDVDREKLKTTTAIADDCRPINDRDSLGHKFDDHGSCKHSDSTNNLNDYNHPMKFKSVYPSQNSAGQKYVTTFSSDIVDYIFYTPKLRLESYKELLTEDQLANIGPIPNSDFPSDHITLRAKFILK